MCRIVRITGIAALVLFLSGPLAVEAADYQAEDAGHPVRIAAYILHPVGWLIDRLIFYPAWWIGQKQPFRTIFGVAAESADDAAPADPPEATESGTP